MPRSKKQRRDNHSYFVIIRDLLKVIKEIRKGGFPNKPALAELIGVTEKTIQRYLSTLRDLGAPIVFDRSQNGFYFQDKTWRLDLDR